MSSTQGLGGSPASGSLPQAPKRTAEQADLPNHHDASQHTDRRMRDASPALRGPPVEHVSAFIPTPGLPSAAPNAPRSAESPRHQPPPLPTSNTTISSAERVLLRDALTADSPAERLQSCLYKWSRQNNDRMDLQGLENVLRRMAACDHLAQDDAALVGALQTVADMRVAFGDNVTSKVRKAWFSAMDILPREVPPATLVTQNRRSTQAARLSALRAAMMPLFREAHTQRLLMTATGTASTLEPVEAFLRQHTAFELPFDGFIAITLAACSDKWLAAANWDSLTTMAGHIACVASSSAQATELITGLLAMKNNDIRLFGNFMDQVCGAPETPAQQALWQQMFLNIQRHGYTAVSSCRRAFIPVNTSMADKLRIAQALGAFADPQAAALASEVLRPDGVDPRRSGFDRPELIDLLTRLPTELPFEVDTLTMIMRQGLFTAWLRAMKDTPLRGAGVAEAIAASVLFEGTIQGDAIVFSSSPSPSSAGRSWSTPQSNIPWLMMAAQAWGVFDYGPRPPSAAGHAMCQLAGEAIVATGGRIIPFVRDNVPVPALRPYFAQAAALSPEALMPQHLREAFSLSRFMVLTNTEANALAPALMAVARAETTELARAFLDAMFVLRQARHLSHATVLRLALQAQPQVAWFHARSRHLTTTLPPQQVPSMLMPYYSAFGEATDVACALLQRTCAAAQPFAGGIVTIERLMALPKALLRVREALPAFLERAQARGVSDYEVLNVVAVIAQLPANGVRARIALAVFQTDDALAMLASPPPGLTRRDVFAQLVRQGAERARDAENVHEALRMRSADAAIAYLRGLGDGTPLDIDGHEKELIALIESLTRHASASSIWHRRRTLTSRSTIENARYVMMGAFAPGPDFSLSVVETPAYRELCALIWRAIAIYQHPTGDAQARAHEQKLMREDTVLALAECVKDENQGRVCSVGFKQRLIGVLQGDDRYPDVLVDTTSAAQLLGVLSETFDKALQGREPLHEELATFADEAVQQARRRFAENPAEATKFEADLKAFLSVQYDYPSEGGSQSA